MTDNGVAYTETHQFKLNPRVRTSLFEDITTNRSLFFKDNTVKKEEGIKSLIEHIKGFLGMKSLVKVIEQGKVMTERPR